MSGTETDTILPISATDAEQPALPTILRETALTGAVLRETAFSRTRALATDLDVLEADLAHCAENLCAALSKAIADSTQDATRTALIQAKRAAFNQRALPALPARPISVRGALDQYQTAWERLELAEQRVPVALIADEAACDAALARIWAETPLADALLVTQPDIWAQAQKLLEDPAAHPKKWRRMRVRLLSYLARMAAKTSPMGAFGATGFAAQTSRAQQVDAPYFLDPATARSLIDACLGHLGLAAPLMPNPSIRITQDGAIHSLAPRRGKKPEHVVALSDQPEAVLLILLARQATTAQTGHALIDLAATALNRSDIDFLTDMAEALIAQSILIPVAPAAECSADLPGHLATLMADDPLAAQLRMLQSGLDTLGGSGDVLARQIRTVADALHPILSRFDIPFPSCPVTPTARTRHQRQAVTTLPVAVEVALTTLSDITILFDPNHGAHAALSDAFVEQFGPDGTCDDPLGFLANVDVPTFALTSAQQAAQDQLIEALHARLRSGERSVTLEPSFLEFLRAGAQRFSPKSGLPVSLLGHLMPVGDDPQTFVFNRSGPGLGALSARHLSRVEDIDAFTRGVEHALAPQVPLILTGQFGFAGQDCVDLDLPRLIYPGEHGRPASKPVQFQDLSLKQGADGALELVHNSDMRRFAPLHFGTLAPQMLPQIYQRLLLLGPCAWPDMPLLELLDQTADQTALRHYPRLIAPALVLMRETWRMPSAMIPARQGGEAEFNHFRRFDVWRRANDIPAHIYLNPMSTAQAMHLHPGKIRSIQRLRKPIFLDLTDMGALRLLWRYLDPRSTTLTITEALPDPLDTPDRPHREYVFERGVAQ